MVSTPFSPPWAAPMLPENGNYAPVVGAKQELPDGRGLQDRGAVHLAQWIADQLQPLSIWSVEVER